MSAAPTARRPGRRRRGRPAPPRRQAAHRGLAIAPTASRGSGTGSSVTARPVWPSAQFGDVGAAGFGDRAAWAWARGAVRAASAPRPTTARRSSAARDWESSTSAPSRSRSAPSTTTVSPGLSPSRIATLSPSCTPSLTRALVHGLVGIDDEDEGAVGAALDRRHRHHGLVVQRVHQKPDIDELAGEQLVVGVVEHGAQLDRAGGGIDHIVHGGELAAGDLDGLAAILGIHCPASRPATPGP